ncbi:uncharacterized protein LOC123014535 [Tribolium madens]|uniref:uncharacterized protein LOC123014535 n=1 Tax=Tribolium madens TaxID=41895 RepID=UPI001CF73FDF|nr:uncharacterized protein LOC123014535 [Tribolium madens]
MEPSSSSSKRIKVESKPMYSDQQLVGSNLLDDVTSSNSSESLNDYGSSDPGLNFEALRWSTTFVDKSMLIRCLMNDKEHRVLLTAPPRFGKTMACNMLKVFFQIVNSEQELKKKYNLFEDLRIYKCSEKCTDNHECKRKNFFRKHCGQHPVISLDFAQLSAMSYSSFLASLRDMITRQFKKYRCLIHMGDKTYIWSSNNMGELDVKRFLRYLKDADDNDHWIKSKADDSADQYIFKAFRYLIEVVSVYYQTKKTNRKIIMLIDEFDAPFMELLFHKEKDERIITLLRKLMRLLCKDEISAEFVERVMIFSVTAFGGMISLGANNVRRRTFLDKDYDYYKFFGFTKEEVDALVKSTVPESQREKALDEIGIWYNNYTVIGDKDTSICNPVSITNYLPNLVRRSYWIESVGTKYVCELFKFEKMQEKVFPAIRENQNISINTTTTQLDDISTLKKLRESISNCINQEQVDLALQFLTECGYFNVIHKDDTTWTLQIPNQELKAIFTDKLHKALLSVKTNLFNVNQQKSFVNALKSLGCGEEHEPTQYVTFKESVENLYTNRELPKAHFHFHCDLWMLIFGSENFHCFSELPIKKGWSPRLDLIIITKCAAIIIEVKRNEQDSAKKALKQCIEKKYYEIFESMENEIKGLKKILMGLHLSDDGNVSIRYLANFEPNRITSIKKIVEEDSYEC